VRGGAYLPPETTGIATSAAALPTGELVWALGRVGLLFSLRMTETASFLFLYFFKKITKIYFWF